VFNTCCEAALSPERSFKAQLSGMSALPAVQSTMTLSVDDKANTTPEKGKTRLSSRAGEVDGSGRLFDLATIGEELGSKRVSDEARSLAARVTEGRFYVACIGQFKRGKSTLINALVEDSILPVGFTPVTAVPTVIRYGERRRARVHGRDGTWLEIPVADLREYVSEEHNPENAKGVEGAEAFVPSSLLAAGMCLVDTPGLGSAFGGNTAATQAFVPHIDAALVVVGADPPLAGDELAVVKTVANQVQDLIIVLNKADRTTDGERAAAVEFTDRLLKKHLQRPVGPIFQVSAAERLAEHRGPERDWGKLVEALQRLVQDSGRAIIHAACERGISRLSEQLLAIINEERDTLERPIEESEQRIARMRETIAEAERSMRELGFLLMAEQQHLSTMFVRRHNAFLASVLPLANREFDDTLPTLPYSMGPSYRRRLNHEAQEIARRQVEPWLRSEQEEAEREYRRVGNRFVQMGNDFLQMMADAGIPELARMPHALDPEVGFRIRSKFSFLELIEIAQPASPLRWLADFALGLLGARKMIQADARRFLTRLLETNGTRVQSDILSRVQESRDRLEAEIRKLLHEVSRVADQALARARAARAEGEDAVRAALARLEDVERQVRETRPAH
jgi:GTP-binding protein EngB required for normal cell division